MSAWIDASTETPGRTPPLESRTRPVMELCADAETGRRTTPTKAAARALASLRTMKASRIDTMKPRRSAVSARFITRPGACQESANECESAIAVAVLVVLLAFLVCLAPGGRLRRLDRLHTGLQLLKPRAIPLQVGLLARDCRR